jgi:hypothetical protein
MYFYFKEGAGLNEWKPKFQPAEIACIYSSKLLNFTNEKLIVHHGFIF